MLSKEALKVLIGWEFHGSKTIKGSFKTKEGLTMKVIQCYVLANGSDDDDNDQFYERLQSIVVNWPEKDLIIMIGDLNSIVGMDNTEYEDIMGGHRLTGRKEREW